MADLLEQQLETVPVERLRPHPRNARQGDVGAICESIEANGFYGAVLAQRSSGFILAGNHRYVAAKHAGLAELPVFWVDVDDDRALRLLLVDNRANDLASYDDAALAELLRELVDSPLGLEGTGYDGDALDELLADLEGGLPRAGHTDPDDAPDIDVSTPPITQLGDLILLGEHRLLCGDATKPADVAQLMGGEQADMVWTDPPYNVAYEGKTSEKLKIQNDQMNAEAFYRFLLESFQAMLAVTRPGGAIYVCHSDMEGLNFRRALADAGWLFKQCPVWVKDQFVLSRQDYHSQHEPILYGWAPGAAHQWHADRTQTTVWNFARPKRSEEHPTMKPVEMVEYALGNSSKPGARVLDPFGGSGSTLIACEKTVRRAHILEIDPRYVDVQVRRWEEFTGKKAQRPR